MTYQPEIGPTFPYPYRASEYAGISNVFKPERVLNLNEKEKKEIESFESELFDELKNIKKLGKDSHEVYVKPLQTGQGALIVETIYKHGDELQQWIKTVLVDNGLDPDDKDLWEDATHRAYEDCIIDGVRSGDRDVLFVRLSNLIKEKTGKEIEIKREMVSPENDFNEKEIVEIFSKLDVSRIPKKWRVLIHNYTINAARMIVREEYRKGNGDVSTVENLSKICKIVNPEKLRSRIEKLRIFKDKIKKMERDLGKTTDPVSRGKWLVVDIYRKYVNFQIADDLLVWEGSGDNGMGLVSLDTRKAERIDKFVHGTDTNYEEGNLAVIGGWMRKVSETIERDKTVADEENRVDSKNLGRLATWILKECGFDGKWKIEFRKSLKQTFGLVTKDKTLRLPSEVDRGLIDVLVNLEHEIEGHILSHENSDALSIQLKIMKNYSSGGRDEVLEEAGAKYVENLTMKLLTNIDSHPENIYLQGIDLRKKGGTFRDCLDLFFAIRAKRLGISKSGAINDSEMYGQVFEYAYDRAMRLFREHTSLDDRSGRVTTTDQLKYLEQARVANALVEQGLEEILFVNGFDIYSIKQLLELGVIDKTRVRRPKMVVANKIWPILRDGLAKEMTVKQILDEQGVK